MSRCEDIVTDFSREKVVTAHKDHKCIECGKDIRIGVQHHNVVGVSRESWSSPGYFWSVRICFQCDKDWTEFRELESDSSICVMYGDLRENVITAFENGVLKSSDSLAQRWVPEEMLHKSEEEEGLPFPLPGQLVLVT
ncbi:MAG: hypothetical protein A3J57_02240 [Candidatus Wildermuthbacteria bacterium RIFCSPHIGHO2_02_FULL_49_12b]|nr:MAG: hypothetical protein A3J57_02240 [Candidatus Wildermuthbacteria bacterium RIFCSPHIGHO2_02_FULL_49_12b]